MGRKSNEYFAPEIGNHSMNTGVTTMEVFDEDSFDVEISYRIESYDYIQTIACKVETKGCELPAWFGARAFKFKSSMCNGVYTQLHHDMPDRGLNMQLFIDKVYVTIMDKERLRTN